jgi:hypothetical protein
MSTPKNPLELKNGYTSYFVLMAFPDTIKAESKAEDISLEDGPEGAKKHGGIVIINDSIEPEVAPSKFMVKDFNFEYVWSSNHINSTISGGSLIISDTSGGEFLTFISEKVTGPFSTSLENMTFVLRIFWTADAGLEQADRDIIKTEPLFFSIPEIDHKIEANSHYYDCDIVALYNTRAQYTSYSRIYGMTVTHDSGNLHDEIPEAQTGGGSIKPRKEEDAEKKDARKTRIEKSKPMKTLGDAFKALEKELNESTKIHKTQLQKWQQVIRDDYEAKLKEPKLKKEIKIKYTITLDSEYANYAIDNRNLPFEQPEQKQDQGGVRVIPTQYGETIDDAIDRIMEYAKEIGNDAGKTPKKDYKVCKVWRRDGDQVLYDIVIKQYVVPFNPKTAGDNTGPGESASKPLEFYYKVSEKDFDVIMFEGSLHKSRALTIIEDVDDSEKARLAFGAEREPITAEREQNIPYFETGYSGNTAKVSNTRTLGVEYPKELAQTIKIKYPIQNIQQSAINITIPGNPDLMSDVMRMPSKVASENAEPALYYKRPEVLPLYAKVIIEHEPIQEGDKPYGPSFYHSEWMHIYKIENIITDGTFFQRLTLLRTDDMV